MWHILILSSAFKNEIMHLQASLFGSLGRLWLSVGQQSPLVRHAARPALPWCSAGCGRWLLHRAQQGQARVLLSRVLQGVLVLPCAAMRKPTRCSGAEITVPEVP